MKTSLNNQICFTSIVMLMFMITTFSPAKAESITVYAAGSLKPALGDVLLNYMQQHNVHIESRFGPSGILREAIESGEDVDIFVSANMTHPQMLVKNGWGKTVTLLTRNQVCALAKPDIDLTSENFLEKLIHKKIRLGTSTPESDPSGDYAWKLFHKAENYHSGSYQILTAKAQKLTGGPDSPKAPENRNPYAWVMQQNQVDIFLTYCTNANLAKKENPTLKVISPPSSLAVGASYGLIISQNASQTAHELAAYFSSASAMRILADYGFYSSN